MKGFVSNALRSFVCALCAAALGALGIALMLALYDIPRTVELAVPLWAGMLLAQAVVCELLSRRNVSMLAYLCACAVILFFGGEQVITHTVFIPGSGGFPVLLRMCVWISGAACAFACQHEPGSNLFVRLSDVLILSCGGYMATMYALREEMIPAALALGLVSLLLCMLAAASLRAGGESGSVVRGAGMGGYLVIGALLGICLLLAVLLLTIAGGHVDSLVNAFLLVWDIVRRAVIAALTAISVFLATLLGGQRRMDRQHIIQEDSLAYSIPGMNETGSAPQWFVYLFMGLIAAVILAAFVAILWALHSAKLGRTRKNQIRRRVTRTNHIGAAIRALFMRITGMITFELRYRINRYTPQGLYVLAIRACRVKRIPRRKRESPGAYMRRLHGMLLAQGSASSLDLLADTLDRALYGGELVKLPRSEYDALAAQIHAISAPPLIKTQKSG